MPATDGSLAQLVDEQARFRLEGSGPVSQRNVVPVTAGARSLLERAPAARDAIAAVLALVEQTAGGAAASRSVKMNGIAFSDTIDGHAANTFAAAVDDDREFAAEYRSANNRKRERLEHELVEESFREAPASRAIVSSGWMNLGPEVSLSTLAARGVEVAGAANANPALAVRVLSHESRHVVDDSTPKLRGGAGNSLHEAIAEAHSTDIPRLRAARATLGMDAVVSDGALEATLAVRPYRHQEAVLAEALRVAGVDPSGPDASRILIRPASEIAEFLVQGIASAEGTSPGRARDDLSRELDSG